MKEFSCLAAVLDSNKFTYERTTFFPSLKPRGKQKIVKILLTVFWCTIWCN